MKEYFEQQLKLENNKEYKKQPWNNRVLGRNAYIEHWTK